MADNINDDALRSQVRMQLAFWKAKDRRSITTGPGWLWRGPAVGPRRLVDLRPATAEKIFTRRRHGMQPSAIYSPAGPRRHRIPRSVSAGRAAVWLAAAAALGGLGLHLHTSQPRAAAVCAVLAAAAAILGVGMAAAEVWARRDPLRLSATETDDVAAAVRSIHWNPLAGSGPVSAAGAYMLEALDTCTQLRAHPAWRLPAAEPLRWQVDLDEEIFQIARAAAALDRADTGGPAALSRQSARQLEDALFDRLVALHRCLHTLSDLAQAASPETAEDDQLIRETLAAAVENELRTGEWTGLNADLLAHIDGYAVLAEVKTSPR